MQAIIKNEILITINYLKINGDYVKQLMKIKQMLFI
jgi:hypothetical protein